MRIIPQSRTREEEYLVALKVAEQPGELLVVSAGAVHRLTESH